MVKCCANEGSSRQNDNGYIKISIHTVLSFQDCGLKKKTKNFLQKDDAVILEPKYILSF